MKKNFLLITALVAATGLFATTANAADGNINFNGSVTSATCTVSNTAVAVKLPTVSASTLASANSWAGRTPFSIGLTGCSTGVSTVSAYFEPGPTINAAGNLVNTTATTAGGAGNVDIQVLNNSYGVIDLNNQSNTTTASVTSGSATLNYFAQYFTANGSASAGSVTSTVAFTIQYQ